MRIELRETLKWCLEQNDGFLMKDASEQLKTHKSTIWRSFMVLEKLGHIHRNKLLTLHYFTVQNRMEAIKAIKVTRQFGPMPCVHCGRICQSPRSKAAHELHCSYEIGEIKQNMRLVRELRKVIKREKQYQYRWESSGVSL